MMWVQSIKVEAFKTLVEVWEESRSTVQVYDYRVKAPRKDNLKNQNEPKDFHDAHDSER